MQFIFPPISTTNFRVSGAILSQAVKMSDKQKSTCWVSHIILDIIIDLGCVEAVYRYGLCTRAARRALFMTVDTKVLIERLKELGQ